MAVKKALIFGVTGQDGAYLADFLIGKGYLVYGTSRDPARAELEGLKTLGLLQKVELVKMSPANRASVGSVLEDVRPDEVYNLAAQSNFAASIADPVETFESIATSTVTLLEAVHRVKREVRVFVAGSGTCFGDTRGIVADERTPFAPKSPYAAAKASAHWAVSAFRSTYQIHACTGILFNHESSLRPASFVTKKVVTAACAIAKGAAEKLTLGDMGVVRDWGWAPDYVKAMWMMLQLDEPDDFVIATGESHTLEEFVMTVFSSLGLDWRQHVDHDLSLTHVADVRELRANPKKAAEQLGWRAEHRMADVAKLMIQHCAPNQTSMSDGK